MSKYSKYSLQEKKAILDSYSQLIIAEGSRYSRSSKGRNEKLARDIDEQKRFLRQHNFSVDNRSYLNAEIEALQLAYDQEYAASLLILNEQPLPVPKQKEPLRRPCSSRRRNGHC